MQAILLACKKYYAENGEWPAQLEDVAAKLESENARLIDPWGEKYNFVLSEMDQVDGVAVERPFIWTKWTVNGKAFPFGWPEGLEITQAMKDTAAKEHIAEYHARMMEEACKKYYVDSGKWPAKLTDITHLLEDGEKGLKDPWGNEYKFAIGKMRGSDGREVEMAYIWSEWKMVGNTRVSGSRPPREKRKV
jgi:hypothetical protein